MIGLLYQRLTVLGASLLFAAARIYALHSNDLLLAQSMTDWAEGCLAAWSGMVLAEIFVRLEVSR